MYVIVTVAESIENRILPMKFSVAGI